MKIIEVGGVDKDKFNRLLCTMGSLKVKIPTRSGFSKRNYDCTGLENMFVIKTSSDTFRVSAIGVSL